MRKWLLPVLCLVSVPVLVLQSALTADASDGVHDQICTPTQVNGQVCVTASFNDTNCDPNSTNNCSGANGAKLNWIEISIQTGTIVRDNQPFWVDKWGDGSGLYLSNIYTLNYVPTAPKSKVYRGTPSSSFRTDIRRLCVRVVSDVYGTVTYFDSLDPYGIPDGSGSAGCPPAGQK